MPSGRWIRAVLERDVERHLVRRVKEAGGLALKWISPGMAGVPDRICVMPGGRIVLVELKRPGGALRPVQVRVIGILQRLGAEVVVLNSKEQIDAVFT